MSSGKPLAKRVRLGVNIDHVATLRQARRGLVPDIVMAARECERAGADSIVVHLREDRRHIQDADVASLRRSIKTRLNLEMSVAPDILDIACRLRPDQATFVPEKRQELTTEGGLDAARLYRRLESAAVRLKKRGIAVSLFIEPDMNQIKAAREMGVPIVELHTGRYADAKSARERKSHLLKIKDAACAAHSLGLSVAAGHGLDYENVGPIARLDFVEELNIGYSIVCQSVFLGLREAVRRMKRSL